MKDNYLKTITSQKYLYLFFLIFFYSNKQPKHTERVEEFWCLSPPQCLVVSRDDVIGLCFVDLGVERHLVQENVHLTHRHMNQV